MVALVLAATVLLNACAQLIPATDLVYFPDRGLNAAIRKAIGKPTGDIYASDLAGLPYLQASIRNISDLEGIQYCLDLERLYLGGNQIEDITPLASLTALTVLWLKDNQIADISPLSGLSNLDNLWLENNQIVDITPLASLTAVTFLWLDDNQIVDISPLSGLSNLESLRLQGNQIADVSPLLDNAGLGPGDVIDIRSNYLNLGPYSSDMQDIQELLDRGAQVRYEPHDQPPDQPPWPVPRPEGEGPRAAEARIATARSVHDSVPQAPNSRRASLPRLLPFVACGFFCRSTPLRIADEPSTCVSRSGRAQAIR